MASIAYGSGQFFCLSQTLSRSKVPCTPSDASITTESIKSEQISSQNPNKPLKTFPSKTPLFSIKNLGVAAAAGVLAYVAYKKLSVIRIGGGGGGGGPSGGGGGGGDGGGFWSFWKRLLHHEDNPDENQSPEWDAHGLQTDIDLQLKKLSGFKRYKVSAIELFDKVKSTVLGSEDSFFELVSLRSDNVYTKSQLQKELQTLTKCGMFEEVDLKAKTNPDGTIGVTVSFKESTWEKAKYFKCINVGSMPNPKSVNVKDNMSEKDKVDFMRAHEKDYNRRIARARPCMLPSSVHGEILQMLGKEKVSARMLVNIRDRVQKWYHDQGYACAQVVDFGKLNTDEVVVEVVEGDITRVEIQFQDKLGNVVENNTQMEEVVKRELPEKLEKGNVFSVEAGMQALDNINALSLFSEIEVNPQPDEKNEGGVFVEIKVKELEQESVEVGGEGSTVAGE